MVGSGSFDYINAVNLGHPESKHGKRFLTSPQNSSSNVSRMYISGNPSAMDDIRICTLS